jgi:hypothetical protein
MCEMVARFEKDDMKTLDGFDKPAGYQMVPAIGGTAANSFPWRFMTAITENHPCQLTVDDPNVVELRSIEQQPRVINNTVIPPHQRMDFLIAARTNSSGQAGVSLMDVDNPKVPILVTTINVSVKTEVKGKYAILMLSDTPPGRRPDATARSPTEAVHLMSITASTFLWQANVNLTQVGEPTRVVVASDLGFPLNVDDVARVLSKILAATPPVFMDSDINRMYCCWDVADAKDATAVGETRRRNCFVEDGTNANTFAHELGHALGLKSHNIASKPGRFLLMDESVSSTQRQFKLEQFEIDTLNPSGT